MTRKLLLCLGCIISNMLITNGAHAEGIRFSVWDSQYTTPNSGTVRCRIEFNDSVGRYTLPDGSVGELHNVTYNRAAREIDACWCYRGQRGVVRWDIRDSDTSMVGVWGYRSDQDVGLWDGRRLD